MKQVIIKIKTVNDAFMPYVNDEVARILIDAAERIKQNKIPAGLYDINGNKVGEIETK